MRLGVKSTGYRLGHESIEFCMQIFIDTQTLQKYLLLERLCLMQFFHAFLSVTHLHSISIGRRREREEGTGGIKRKEQEERAEGESKRRDRSSHDTYAGKCAQM